MFIVEQLVRLVAPHECIGCKAEGSLVCAWCWPDFCTPVPSRCFMCRVATDSSAVCSRCRRKTPLRHVWVRTELAGNAQKLLYMFKFERAQSAAVEIGQLMSEALPYSQDALLVPVPPATSRLRQRGYDHIKLLVGVLVKETGLPAAKVLSRLGQSRQVGMKREERLRQLEGAFWVRNPSLVAGRRVWLIDDVVTTGATLSEAAKVLKKAGAKSVDAVVFAQK